MLFLVGTSLLSCSSDDSNDENTKHEVLEKRLKKVLLTEIDDGEYLEYSFFYNSSNKISDIHAVYGKYGFEISRDEVRKIVEKNFDVPEIIDELFESEDENVEYSI